MNKKEELFEEARELLAGGVQETTIEKKVILDKSSGQFSIKIPREMALRAGLNKHSIFKIVFNPSKEETLNEVDESQLLLFPKKK